MRKLLKSLFKHLNSLDCIMCLSCMTLLAISMQHAAPLYMLLSLLLLYRSSTAAGAYFECLQICPKNGIVTTHSTDDNDSNEEKEHNEYWFFYTDTLWRGGAAPCKIYSSNLQLKTYLQNVPSSILMSCRLQTFNWLCLALNSLQLIQISST